MNGLTTRFLSFAAIGAAGTTVHYAVLVVLVEGIGTPAAVAAGLGALVGAVVNYLMNYRFTFRSSARHSVAAPRFALIAVVGIALNALTVFVAVRLGIHYFLGQLLATLLILVCGFLANQFWTFTEATNGDRHNR